MGDRVDRLGRQPGASLILCGFMDDLPKVHPTHHRRTMVGLFVLVGMLVVLGLAAEMWEVRQGWFTATLAGMWLVSFVGWLLWRVNHASCPQCGRGMKHVGSASTKDVQMEIFCCPECGGQWSVPGISND